LLKELSRGSLFAFQPFGLVYRRHVTTVQSFWLAENCHTTTDIRFQ